MDDLWAALMARLTAAQKDALNALLTVAEQRRLPVYLVGGSVRDLVLGRPGIDIDLVVEGPAIDLAQAFASVTGASVRRHQAFGTATVSGEGFRFDLVTARRETYRHPGALPTVRPSTLADDLARRDFTINAMALGLTPAERGRLFDPFHGQDDLHARLIRVLHTGSFRDDATRMLRAVRYAERLRFDIEPGTLALVKRDRSYLETISGARIRHEIERMLQEDEPERMLRRCDDLGLLCAIDPALHFGPDQQEVYRRARDEAPPAVLQAVYWCALALGAGRDSAPRIAGRLDLNARLTAALTCVPEVVALRAEIGRPGLRPSEAARLLDRRPEACLWTVALTWKGLEGETVRRYLTEWRSVRPRLTGQDLREMGVPAGPEMGRLLQRLRDARLDGAAQSAADERRLVAHALAQLGRDG